jgi:hypothetical protein
MWTIWRSRKLWPYQDSNPDLSVFQPLTSRYTDCTTIAHILVYVFNQNTRINDSNLNTNMDVNMYLFTIRTWRWSRQTETWSRGRIKPMSTNGIDWFYLWTFVVLTEMPEYSLYVKQDDIFEYWYKYSWRTPSQSGWYMALRKDKVRQVTHIVTTAHLRLTWPSNHHTFLRLLIFKYLRTAVFMCVTQYSVVNGN